MMTTSHSSRECPHCGHILATLTHSYGKRHIIKCRGSHPAERKYFKSTGHWPRKPYPKKVLEEMAEDEQTLKG